MRQVQGPKDMPWAAAHIGAGMDPASLTLIWASAEMLEQTAEAAADFPYDTESFERFTQNIVALSGRTALVMFPAGCIPDVTWAYPHEPGRLFTREVRGFLFGLVDVPKSGWTWMIALISPWQGKFIALTFLTPGEGEWIEGELTNDLEDITVREQPRLVGGPTAAQLGTFLMAMVSLMNEPNVVSTTRVAAPRKDVKANGGRELDIRRIELRPMRYERTADRDPTGRVYTHRWVVKGHWRRQWYATTGKHEPKWIAPYLKGPEGAPLLTAPKVYVWNR